MTINRSVAIPRYRSLSRALCLAIVTLVYGCSAPRPPLSLVPVPHADEWLAREDVQHRFGSRAAAGEIRELAALMTATDLQSQTRALELVLFRLDANELFDLGITQVEHPDGPEWSIAWSDDSDETYEAIEAALAMAGTGASGSSGLGYTGWYVPREQFFLARSALLQSPEIKKLGVSVVSPNLGQPLSRQRH